MDDLLSEFLTETNEGLAVLDVELVKLEQNPNDDDLLSNIFRYMHTIKGTCGFLGLPRLESVAHAGENVLGKIREGDLVVTPAAVSLILECLDSIRSILMVLEETESEPAGDDSDLIGRLNVFADSGDSGTAPTETATASAEDVFAEAKIAAQASAQETVAEVDENDAAETVAEAPTEAPAETLASQLHPAQPAAGEEVTTKESAVANQSIRVNVELLENLMTMVS